MPLMEFSDFFVHSTDQISGLKSVLVTLPLVTSSVFTADFISVDFPLKRREITHLLTSICLASSVLLSVLYFKIIFKFHFVTPF